MFVLAIAPRRVIRVEHEPVSAAERPSIEPAAARCLLHHAMFTRALLHKEKYLILSPKLPSDPVRDFPYS
mgnify:CR=1 FL=1